MFVNTKNPYMFRSFLFDHRQGLICRALCRYYDVFRWFAFVEYFIWYVAVYVSSICVCAWCCCRWKTCLWTVWYGHTPNKILNERKSAEDIIVTAQSTAY